MARSAATLRLTGDLLLGSRRIVAAFVHRHPDQVRQRCEPVACDVGTRALLYDAEAAAEAFAEVARRMAI